MIIDTNDNVGAHLATLKERGVTAIGRYYSRKAWKRITIHEAQAISAAGLDLFVVFEDDGNPALTTESGINDGQIALVQAKAIGQPLGSAIYFALEHLPDGYKSEHIPAIKDYVRGLKQSLEPKYKIGVYSDGIVCSSLQDAGLIDFAWLSASLAFEGSRQYYAGKKWSLAQDKHVDQNWNGISVDINEAVENFGQFRVSATTRDGDAVSRAVTMVPAPLALNGPAFGERARDIAVAEWRFFGGQTYDVRGAKDHAGHTEGEEGYYQRVGTYWLEGTNTHSVDGLDHDQYWSATFISWVMRKAGAGDRFRYSSQHSVYINQGIKDFLRKRLDAGYWTVRLNEATPEVGDLVCWTRRDGIDYDHQNGGDYPGHSDIVVAVENDLVWIIGGNVGNSVTRRPLALAGGFLKPVVQGGETLIALMKKRI